MHNSPPLPPQPSHSSQARGAGRRERRLGRRLARWLRSALALLRLVVTLELVSRLRRRRAARALARSGLFDARHYLSQCGDDPEARKDPIGHYLATGSACGLEPTPLFDRARWIASHPAAGSPGKDAFLEFVRSRRGIAKGPLRTAVVPRRPAEGEALLARHPFRAPAGDGAARRALVVGADAAGADPARLAAIAEALREAGWSVTIAADVGAELLAHLAASGAVYDAALVAGPEAAFAALPALRAYAAQAVVAYDPAWLRAASAARGGDRAARGGDERLGRLERVNAACADVVLAATREEREALARLEGIDAALLEDAQLSPGAAKADVGALLLARGSGAGGAIAGGGAG